MGFGPPFCLIVNSSIRSSNRTDTPGKLIEQVIYNCVNSSFNSTPYPKSKL